MKTIHFILVIGLLVPNLGFAYDLPEDIAVNKNIVSEAEDPLIPDQEISNAAISLGISNSAFTSIIAKHIAFWRGKLSDKAFDTKDEQEVAITEVSVKNNPFTIDCVRNL